MVVVGGFGGGEAGVSLVEREVARESSSSVMPPTLHVPSLDGIHALCGYRLRHPEGPITWGWTNRSCIVCDDLWNGLSFAAQDAICEFARRSV